MRVCLLQTVKLLPHQRKMVLVKVGNGAGGGPLLIERALCDMAIGLKIDNAIVTPHDQIGSVVVGNSFGFTQVVGGGRELSMATEVEVIDPEDSSTEHSGDGEGTVDTAVVSTGRNGTMVVMAREVSGVELVEDREKGKKGGQTDRQICLTRCRSTLVIQDLGDSKLDGCPLQSVMT